MDAVSIKTPVAFIIFNRPENTRRVFEQIRRARPEKLYIIADAPRKNKAGEAQKCAEVRKIVESLIDWPCEVHKDYAEENLGCSKRIQSGLDWVFDCEEEAIIIEDDILTDTSFFPFCESMLEAYRDNHKIMQVSGFNCFNFHPEDNASYFYSRYSSIWGWGTWRRAWIKNKNYDARAWQKIVEDENLVTKCLSKREAQKYLYVVAQELEGKIDEWAMRWHLTKTLEGGWGIIPAKNLVQNIGCGLGASHTLNPFNANRFVKLRTLNPPYNAPQQFCSNLSFDRKYNRSRYGTPVFLEKAKHLIISVTKKLLSLFEGY